MDGSNEKIRFKIVYWYQVKILLYCYNPLHPFHNYFTILCENNLSCEQHVRVLIGTVTKQFYITCGATSFIVSQLQHKIQ
jgi:hypothetical protein